MNYTLIERFRMWVCRNFGHKVWRCPETDIELCRRCSRLLTTPYSREKGDAA